jgi:predicted metal-dependent enzyme (double-stranded beta helix superfamily)
MRTHDAFDLSRRSLLLTGCVAATAGVVHAEAARPAHTPHKFDAQRFVEDCKAAASEADAQRAVQEVMQRELVDRDAVLAGLGAPTKGGLRVLYQSPGLTILNIVWSPLMQLLPHEHDMWALIGIYTGREDNIFWRRAAGSLEAVGASALSAGSVTPLPRDVIHSVNNPIEKLTGAIHIYGGDFFKVRRSEWDAETLAERDWDLRGAVRNFEQSNARFFGGGCGTSAG